MRTCTQQTLKPLHEHRHLSLLVETPERPKASQYETPIGPKCSDFGGRAGLSPTTLIHVRRFRLHLRNQIKGNVTTLSNSLYCFRVISGVISRCRGGKKNLNLNFYLPRYRDLYNTLRFYNITSMSAEIMSAENCATAVRATERQPCVRATERGPGDRYSGILFIGIRTLCLTIIASCGYHSDVPLTKRQMMLD